VLDDGSDQLDQVAASTWHTQIPFPSPLSRLIDTEHPLSLLVRLQRVAYYDGEQATRVKNKKCR
jgi:hypothetical protein